MTDYDLLAEQARALLGEETDPIANAANFAALVYSGISEVSWAGFYYARESGELVLGPFQGRPACVRLPKGRGVCGIAFSERRTLVVDDVAEFPDHIVCDAAARSEIVVPLLVDNFAYGVFDVDSARVERFGPKDSQGIERLVDIFLSSTAPPKHS